MRERDLAMDLIRKDVLGEEPEARHEPRDRRAFAKRIQAKLDDAISIDFHT